MDDGEMSAEPDLLIMCTDYLVASRYHLIHS